MKKLGKAFQEFFRTVQDERGRKPRLALPPGVKLPPTSEAITQQARFIATLVLGNAPVEAAEWGEVLTGAQLWSEYMSLAFTSTLLQERNEKHGRADPPDHGPDDEAGGRELLSEDQ